MKRIKNILLFIVMIFVFYLALPTTIVLATTSAEDILLTSGTVVIKKDTTVAQVTQQYGSAPKIETVSPFGGKAYTYYTGDFQNLIYIETLSDGTIISYGACSDDFTSTFYSAGDEVKGTSQYMQGTYVNYSKKVYGVLTYRKDLMTEERIEDYYLTFLKDNDLYERDYGKHSVAMYNHFSSFFHSDCRAEFNEKIFNTIRGIINNGMSIENYAEKNKKEGYYKVPTGLYHYGNDTSYTNLPNPMTPMRDSIVTPPTESIKYGFFDFVVLTGESGNYIGATQAYLFDENFIKKKENEIALTAEEQEKYNQMVTMYHTSVEEYNSGGSNTFEEEPTYKTTPLVAGKIAESKIKGGVDFLNTIRIGAGLKLVEYSSTLTNYAQHKATLISYINYNNIAVSNPHYPAKPAEVDQTFYDTAQSGMSYENLYNGSVITSIQNAIDDMAGDSNTFGHRYNLLNPAAAKFGIGYCNSQGVHKLSPGNGYSVDAVAWPSIGVTPTEAFVNTSYWSCKFYKKYTPTGSTTVSVKCLNTNRTYDFLSQSANFMINGSLIKFYNADFRGEDGYVYEVTIKNLTNSATGNTEDFSYRAVFKDVYETKEIVYPTSVSFEKPNITVLKGEHFTLTPQFSDNHPTEILTTWSSNKVWTLLVNEAGDARCYATGTSKITAKTLNDLTATCTVTCVDTVNKLQLKDYDSVLKENKKLKLEVYEATGIEFSNEIATWTSSDTSIAKVKNGIVTGIKEGVVTITASYKDVKVEATIYIIPASANAPWLKLVSNVSYGKLLSDGEEGTISLTQSNSSSVYLEEFEADFVYNSSNIEFIDFEPLIDGLSYSKTSDGVVHFQFNANGALRKISGTLGTFKIKGAQNCQFESNTFVLENIKYRNYGATKYQNHSYQYPVTIKTANAIQSIQVNPNTYTFTSNGIAKTKLNVEFTPAENINNKITWSSSNENIVRVDTAGYIYRVSPGNAVITATTVNGKEGTCTVTVKEPEPVVIDITGVTLNKYSFSLMKGNTQTLTATVKPSNTTLSKEITWTSSDNKVATVDKNGTVKGIAEGKASITATTVNGKQCSCTVSVYIVPISSVVVTKGSATLKKGETLQLTASISPENVTEDKTLTWSSSNQNIATVDSNGLVTAKEEGTVTITAKSKNGKSGTSRITVTVDKFRVTFRDFDGSTLKTETVEKGKSATAPASPGREGYNFIGWDKPFTNVQSDLIVIAQYEQKQQNPSVKYTTHVQTVGWQDYVTDGEMAGTTGKSLRLEGIKIKLENATGGIEYRTHIQSIGWENGWKANDTMSGTQGRSLRLEAIQIRLTGKIADQYDVYYCVHSQCFGWMNWVKNGDSAGTEGFAYRLEGIKIKLVPKGEAAPAKLGTQTEAFKSNKPARVWYSTHVQTQGWQGYSMNGAMSGTTGKSLRLEGIKIKLEHLSGGIQYRTHIQSIGWENGWKANDEVSGTTGKSLRLEAIQIQLTGEAAQKYDVYYRVHAQSFGWMGWAKNGESAGTAGYAYRLEGIEITLVPKGGAAPGSTENAFKQK